MIHVLQSCVLNLDEIGAIWSKSCKSVCGVESFRVEGAFNK